MQEEENKIKKKRKNHYFIIFGVILMLIVGGIFIYSKMSKQSIFELLPEFLPAITAYVRQLGELTLPSPLEGTTNNTGENWAYDCFMDFGGGSGSGTTGDGNWTYCSGSGCIPDTLLTSGTSDLTGTDADGLYSCSGNGCGNTHSIQTVTVNTAGDYSLRCEAIDQDGPVFQSSIINITVTGADNTPPTYSNNQTNTTIAGESVNFSIFWNDDTALNPNGTYIFSTNNTGVWVNDSVINFTATPQWANVTKTLNSTAGLPIGYRWYANDSAGNTNNTELFTLITVGYGNFEVSISAPTEGVDVDQNELFNINATVSCVGNTGNVCGTVYALARYNLTANPDTAINITSGADPFFVLRNRPNNSSLLTDLAVWYDFDEGTGGNIFDVNGNITRNGTLINMNETNWIDGKVGTGALTFNGTSQYVNTSYNLPSIGCAVDCSISIWAEINISETSDHLIGDFGPAGGQNGLAMRTANSNDLVTFIYAGNNRITLIDIFPVSGWYHIVFAKNSSAYSIYVNGTMNGTTTTGDIGDAGESFKIGTRGDLTDYWRSGIDEVAIWTRQITLSEITELYNYYNGTTYPRENPATSTQTLEVGESETFNWTVKISTATEVSYLVDVFFNSSYGNSLVADNDTDNRQVDLNPSAPAPTNCWGDITGGIYVPSGCTYYIPDSTYIT